MREPNQLVERILAANRTAESLAALRKQAADQPGDFQLDNRLLLYQERLVVPTQDTLVANLIQEAHDQISSAHPSKAKTARILSQKYY